MILNITWDISFTGTLGRVIVLLCHRIVYQSLMCGPTLQFSFCAICELPLSLCIIFIRILLH